MRELMIALLAVMSLTAAPLRAGAAEITVFASVAMKAAFDELVPRFEALSGHTIVAHYGSAPGIRQQIDAGEPFDISIIPAAGTDELIKSGILLTDPHPVVGVTAAAFAYRNGTPKPDIATEAAFKATVLGATGISLSDPSLGGASANYFMAVTRRLGIADPIRDKLQFTRPGYGAAPVAAGTTQYGVALTSEVAGVPGVSGVLIFPADPASTTTLLAGISAKSTHAEADRAFLDFLAAPDAVAIRKAKGLVPD